MINYERMARTTKRLIEGNGRRIEVLRTATQVSPANSATPWKGAGSQGSATPIVERHFVNALFAVPATSIPTESRGLAYDWVAKDLLLKARHVFLVAALGNPDLKMMNQYIDTDGSRQEIIWGQLLKPGTVPLLYCFGTSV